MKTSLTSRVFQLIFIMLLFTIPMAAKALEQRCNDNAETSTPTERFVRNNNGSVFDKATRLEWQVCVRGMSGARCDIGTPNNLTWWEALGDVAAFNTASHGHRDWRLPDIKELYSIIETACEEPSLNKMIFINHPLSPEVSKSWSSTPSTSNGGKAWQIEFQNGLLYSLSNNERLTVRLVRTCDEECQQAYD